MSNAPVFVRGNYSDFYGSGMLPVLEEIFRSELELHPSRREMLAQVKKTDRDIYQSTEIHDMPLFSQVSESEDYSYSRPKQGADKTIIPVKYGLGFSISEEAIDDGKFDFVADAVRKMAESARESQEVAFMNLFNNGFSSETTADGVALFSASHTLPSGSTLRNVITTAADLSQTSLDEVISDFETEFVGDSGIIRRMEPKILLVHSDNKRYAKELVGSDLKPDSSDNNMNSLKDEGIIVVSSPHLSDRDAWFLLADKSKTGLRIISRKGIETKSDSVFSNDSIRYKSRYREKVAAISPWGVMGSAGA